MFPCELFMCVCVLTQQRHRMKEYKDTAHWHRAALVYTSTNETSRKCSVERLLKSFELHAFVPPFISHSAWSLYNNENLIHPKMWALCIRHTHTHTLTQLKVTPEKTPSCLSFVPSSSGSPSQALQLK